MIPRGQGEGAKLPSLAGDRYVVKREKKRWQHIQTAELPQLVKDGVELAVWEDRPTKIREKDGKIQHRELSRISKNAKALLDPESMTAVLDAPTLPKRLNLKDSAKQQPLKSYNDIIGEVGNGGYDVAHYEVRLDADFESKSILGLTTVKAKATQDLESLSLDFMPFPHVIVEVNGEAARFKQENNELQVVPEKPIERGQDFSVDVLYEGAPHEVRESFIGDLPFGMRFVDGALSTISEPRSTRGWFPCNDHPADKATFDFEIAVPKGYEANAGGLLAEEKVIENGAKRQLTFRPRDPMAPYVVPLNAFKSEDYDIWSQASGNGVPIENSLPKDSKPIAREVLNKTPQVVDFLESYLGDYPFEVLGNHNFRGLFGGAFEAQTRNVYTQSLMEIESVNPGGSMIHPPTEVLAHEITHQWFGDSVSINRWKDIWMKEAFATYFGAAYAAHEYGVDLDAHMNVRYERARARVSDYVPGDLNPQTMYSGDAYNLMAGGVHALRKELGEESFKTVVKTFLNDYAGKSVEITDFVTSCEELTGKNLKPFFNKWVYASRLPEKLPA